MIRISKHLTMAAAMSCLCGFSPVSAAEETPQPVVIEDLGLTLLWVPPGKLPGVKGDDPARTVRDGFWLGKTELTQLQWRKVMSGQNPSENPADNDPVQRVSYLDLFPFVERLNEREKQAGRLPEGYVYTLPNELQWIYAARAGDETDGAATLEAQAWTKANSGGKINAVATKAPNAWGFHDMRGNVWEWCQETPGISSKGRFVRGGSIQQAPAGCGYNTRLEAALDELNPHLGLRLALTKTPLVKPAVPSPEVVEKTIPAPSAPQIPAPPAPQIPVPSAPRVSSLPPPSNGAKTTQTIGGVRIEASHLVVVFEDRAKPIKRPDPTTNPPPSSRPTSSSVNGVIVASGWKYSEGSPFVSAVTPERQELKSKIAKDLEKNMPSRSSMERSGQGGLATHEDSFNEMLYHALKPETDAILWVTDLNSPFTMEEVEKLTTVLARRKIRLYIFSTQNTATEDTKYRRDSQPGFKLMDYVRSSGGSFRKEKLKQ